MNPWMGSTISIAEMSGKQVIYEMSKDGVISFKTSPDHSYLIRPQVSESQILKTKFISELNLQPKKFFEATLGKERNF